MGHPSRGPASRLRLQFSTAVLAAAVGTLAGYKYGQYTLGEGATRELVAMYACFGAVAALMTVRLGALAYRLFTDR